MKASSVSVGSSAVVYGQASGGFGAYKYSVKVKFPGETTWRSFYNNTTKTSMSFAAVTKGTYYVQTTVKDESGQSVVKTLTFKAV